MNALMRIPQVLTHWRLLPSGLQVPVVIYPAPPAEAFYQQPPPGWAPTQAGPAPPLAALLPCCTAGSGAAQQGHAASCRVVAGRISWLPSLKLAGTACQPMAPTLLPPTCCLRHRSTPQWLWRSRARRPCRPMRCRAPASGRRRGWGPRRGRARRRRRRYEGPPAGSSAG